MAAQFALRKVRPTGEVETLIEDLKDDDWGTRQKAVETLGRIGHASAVEPLLQALEEGRGWRGYRETLIAALWGIGEPAVEALTRALNDQDWLIRMRAAQALGRIGDASAVEALTQALKDKDRRVREVAKRTLEMIELGKSGAEPEVGTKRWWEFWK